MMLKLVLLNQILALLSNGVTWFLSGMAQGVDIWASEIILELKKHNNNINLLCVLPCETQANKWSCQQRERYFDILAQCDKTVYVSHHYTNQCISERNRFLVNHSTFLLAVYDGTPKGGTAQMVSYATANKRPVILINPDTAKVTPYIISNN